MAAALPTPAPVRAVSRRSQKKLVGLLAFALLTLFVTAGKNHDVFTDPNSQMLAHYRPGMIFLIPHAFFAAIAMFSALFQFSTRLRIKYPGFHRKLGYVYVAAVFIGAPLGIGVASRLTPHDLFAASFIQSFGWMFCTGVALYCIRNGNVAEHRRWMIRGYPFAVVFTVARTIIPFFAPKYGDTAVTVTVYCCIALAGFLPTIFLDWPKMPKRART